jgi:hypothetical protein
MKTRNGKMTRKLGEKKTHTREPSPCSVEEFPFSGHSLSARQI